MDYLGLLLVILILHCVYAEYYWQPEPLIVLYNPETGREMDPRLYRDMQLRSAGPTSGQNINDNIVRLPSLGTPCSCEDYVCRCCLGIGFGSMKQTVCIKIQYEWREFDVRFFIDWNDRTLASFGISPAQNMPDFCTPLVLPVPIFSCLRLSNIQIIEMENSLNLCISLVFKMVFYQIFEYKFTCMRLGMKGVSIVRDPYSYMDMNPSKLTAGQPMPQTTNDKLQIYDA
ncbi:uncharacterized protein LOC117574995 [Drosophila albomicans]|uniref:Uncharacterized protein LOC117574995 n=1 Tax=Drosophila albomicans TaxID=7291 RepID=A0A6P8XPI0_DROAB|nr:uncharacterized protein LOC117574995 [Drosophila albomicans]